VIWILDTRRAGNSDEERAEVKSETSSGRSMTVVEVRSITRELLADTQVDGVINVWRRRNIARNRTACVHKCNSTHMPLRLEDWVWLARMYQEERAQSLGSREKEVRTTTRTSEKGVQMMMISRDSEAVTRNKCTTTSMKCLVDVILLMLFRSCRCIYATSELV
jgi:hypothetical protein